MLTLHIGLPKTGTTLLQHRIFKRARGLRFVHRYRGNAALALARCLRHHGQAGDPLAGVERPLLVAWLDRWAAGGLPVLVSDESISLVQYRFWSDGAAGPERVAERLAALAGRLRPSLRPCRVLLGIRRQDRWLASSYAHCAERRRHFCQSDFDRRLTAIAEGREDAGLGWLDYARTRGVFAERFGAENVLLVPLERLTAEPKETLGEVARFLGGVDLGDPQRVAAGASHRRAVDAETWRTDRSGGALRLDPALAARVRARFAASNHALAATTPLGFEP